jgi:DHA2 family methylenomycin A resistance protein-like MFS transporter
MTGFALFTAASLACAMAPTAMVLNISRAVQGIGAALLVPSSLAILNATYADDKAMLAKAIAWWTASGGLSIAAGPVLGGLLMSVAGWRSIFWVNIPICIAGFWLTSRVVPAAAGRDPHRSLDIKGQLLAIVTLTGFIGAVIEYEALGWQHWLVSAGMLVAAAAAGVFVWVEANSKSPMLPLGLFRSAPFSGAVLFGVLMNFSYYGVIFVLSFYLQKVRGFSVLHAGLVFLPLTGTFIFANIASGWMQARTGPRTPMILGGLIGASGYALLGWIGISNDATFMQMLPGLALIPAGMGLGVPAMTTSILSGVEKRQAGTASAVLNTARQVGGAVGVAVFGALVAGGANADILSGIRLAMGISSGWLLLAAALAFACIRRRDPDPAPVPARARA